MSSDIYTHPADSLQSQPARENLRESVRRGREEEEEEEVRVTCELILRLSEVDSVFEFNTLLFTDSFFMVELCCSPSDAVSVIEINSLFPTAGGGVASGGILYPLWVRQYSSYSFCLSGSTYLTLSGCPDSELSTKKYRITLIFYY